MDSTAWKREIASHRSFPPWPLIAHSSSVVIGAVRMFEPHAESRPVRFAPHRQIVRSLIHAICDRPSQFHSGPDAHLVEDAAKVGADGMWRYEKLLGDLTVRPALSSKLGNLHFGTGQRRPSGVGTVGRGDAPPDAQTT